MRFSKIRPRIKVFSASSVSSNEAGERPIAFLSQRSQREITMVFLHRVGGGITYLNVADSSTTPWLTNQSRIIQRA